MGLLRKKESTPDNCVVKFFKTIHQSDFNDIKPCFEIMLDVFLSREYEFTGVEINYGSKQYKKVSAFYKLLETKDVVYFNAGFRPKGWVPDERAFAPADLNSTGIIYSNPLLNLSNKTDEKSYIEFICVIPYEWYSPDLIKSIVTDVDKAIGLTYSYVCFLPKHYDAVAEKPLKITSFSVSATVTKEDIVTRNDMKNIDCGFIPKTYPVNFYNSAQLECIKENADHIEKISDNLTLVTYAS